MAIQSKTAPGNKGHEAKTKTIASNITPHEGHPLRSISEEDFVDLGVGHVVFVRSISAGNLKTFVPEAQSMPADVQFQMIVAANGAPVLIADNREAIEDWFEQNSVRSVLRH